MLLLHRTSHLLKTSAINQRRGITIGKYRFSLGLGPAELSGIYQKNGAKAVLGHVATKVCSIPGLDLLLPQGSLAAFTTKPVRLPVTLHHPMVFLHWLHLGKTSTEKKQRELWFQKRRKCNQHCKPKSLCKHPAEIWQHRWGMGGTYTYPQSEQGLNGGLVLASTAVALSHTHPKPVSYSVSALIPLVVLNLQP